MDKIKNGWFSENNDLWPGQCFSLEVEEMLFRGKSDFQDVLVIKTKNHGNALILDGIIQCTEHDEFSYQETISFIPLCAHPNPEKVLIVGGGDGGVAREVNKHPLVKKCVQVEIDQMVIDVSKKYLPNMAKGFTSPKLDLQVCDGFEYMRNHKNEFDVIITDSSDPVGPAENLFTESYFQMLKDALRPGGVICSQAGNVWWDLDKIKQTMEQCKKHYGAVSYAYASVPTYPTGQIGYVIACTDEKNDLSIPKITFSDEQLEDMDMKYYSSEIHKAAFILPNFAKKELQF